MAQNSDGKGWFRISALKLDPHPSSEIASGELRPTGLGLSDAIMTASIEPMHGNLLVASYLNEPEGTFVQHVLTDKLVEGHALGWSGDSSNRGDDHPSDLVVGWRGKGPGASIGLAVWTPQDEAGRQWKRDR